MVIADDQGQMEKRVAEQIIAETPLLDGLERIAVELGEDHTGDPAMWLVFYMRPGLNANDEWLRNLNEYSNKLGLKIIHSGTTRFPYSRLRQAA